MLYKSVSFDSSYYYWITLITNFIHVAISCALDLHVYSAVTVDRHFSTMFPPYGKQAETKQSVAANTYVTVIAT